MLICAAAVRCSAPRSRCDLADAPRGHAAARSNMPRGRGAARSLPAGTLDRRPNACRRRAQLPVRAATWEPEPVRVRVLVPARAAAAVRGRLARSELRVARAATIRPARRVRYFRGLNLLLNEQHDKAIDAFIEVVKLDPETIELHHALGNLFRRRGEFDRAVRIHTHLLNRADLPGARASPSAGRTRPGLPEGWPARPRRACVHPAAGGQAPPLRCAARPAAHLPWNASGLKAIDVRRACLEKRGRRVARRRDLALPLRTGGRGARAGALRRGADGDLDEALQAHRKSVRALILSGDLAMQRGDRAAAHQAWLAGRGDARRSTCAADRVTRLRDALDAGGRPRRALNWLQPRAARHAVDRPARRGARSASAPGKARPPPSSCSRDELSRHPSLLGFERLLEARLGAGQGRQRTAAASRR